MNFLRRLLRRKPSNSQLASEMRNDWNLRARQNARHFVATLNEEWTDDEFFKSGDIWIGYYIRPFLDVICGGRNAIDMRVLEIGCGAGRMTRGLSELFGSVDAVDISPEMVEKAKASLGDRGNIQFHVNNGWDLSMFSDAQFDFVFSAIVFQHIPSKTIVRNYIQEAHRVLRPRCFFKFEVQGCPIPEESLTSWIGVGFSEQEMIDLARQTDFSIHSTSGAGTQEFWLTFQK